MAADFLIDERFKDLAQQLAIFEKAFCLDPEERAGQTTVHHVQLGSLHNAFEAISAPGWEVLKEEQALEDAHVGAHCIAVHRERR